MTWYKINLYLTDNPKRNVDMLEEFKNIWLNLGAPKGLNLFELKEQPLTQFATYYSPEPQEPLLANFLQKYSAEQCDAPNREEIQPVIHGD